MRFEQHCQRSHEILGKKFEYVHKWLDEFHGHPLYKTKHRKLRHHWKGIEEVREKWGDDEAEAAKLHILDDLRTGEDANADESYIAQNEADYIKKGYW